MIHFLTISSQQCCGCDRYFPFCFLLRVPDTLPWKVWIVHKFGFIAYPWSMISTGFSLLHSKALGCPFHKSILYNEQSISQAKVSPHSTKSAAFRLSWVIPFCHIRMQMQATHDVLSLPILTPSAHPETLLLPRVLLWELWLQTRASLSPNTGVVPSTKRSRQICTDLRVTFEKLDIINPLYLFFFLFFFKFKWILIVFQ